MADNPVSAMAGQFTDKIFGSILWMGIAVIIILALGFTMWWVFYYRKKFDIETKITSERAGDKNRVIFDKAAILYDRSTKSNYFRLWNTQVDLPVPPFNVLQTSNKGDYLELWRKSDNHFAFLMPSIIDKTHIVKMDGKLYPVADQENHPIEADVEFWNVKRKQNNKKMFDTESLMMKLLPFIPHIVGGMILIFVLYILMDKLPAILGSLEEIAKELRYLRQAEVTVSGSTWSLLTSIF